MITWKKHNDLFLHVSFATRLHQPSAFLKGWEAEVIAGRYYVLGQPR